jgi:hypothetical protein
METGSISAAGKLLAECDPLRCLGASAAYAEIAAMKSAIVQTKRTSSLTVREAAL